MILSKEGKKQIMQQTNQERQNLELNSIPSILSIIIYTFHTKLQTENEDSKKVT